MEDDCKLSDQSQGEAETSMHPILLAVLLLLFPSFLLCAKSKRKAASQRSSLPLPPSPPKLPIIGNLHQLGPLLHRSLLKLSAKHGPLMLLYLGRVPTLVVSSPKMAQEILKTHDLVFASRPEVKASRIVFYGSKDLAFAPYGEYWRQVRKLCATHLFSSKMVRSFKPVREEEVTLMLEKIARAATEKGVVPVTDILNSFTNDLICRFVLGSFMKSDERRKLLSEMTHANSVLFGALYAEDFFPGLWWLDALFGSDGKLYRNWNRWDALLEDVIEDHLRRAKAGETKDADFADVLLRLQNDANADLALTREHIKAILMVINYAPCFRLPNLCIMFQVRQDMITAGTETSFGVLDWSLAELIRNPEAMKKAQKEVRSRRTATIREEYLINEDDLTKMDYLKAVIKETLRLHPPVPLLLPRESLEDCHIQDYLIPKQTRVIVNCWAIGRDPEAWEEPEQFRPERFLGSPVDYRGQDFNFIPFGTGRRMCPGMQLATAVVELALANLLHRFEWKLPDGVGAEDVDTSEAPGMSAPRKQKLDLVAVPIELYG